MTIFALVTNKAKFASLIDCELSNVTLSYTQSTHFILEISGHPLASDQIFDSLSSFCLRAKSKFLKCSKLWKSGPGPGTGLEHLWGKFNCVFRQFFYK